MGKKSKTKGNKLENETAHDIRGKFMPFLDPKHSKTAYNLVHRTPQSGGHVERGDLICKPPILKYFPWFIEARNREVWTWKALWEKGQDSLLMKWFLEDACDKCHPYDQNKAPTHHRFPMLLFTRNFQKKYFIAWEYDIEIIFNDYYQSGWGFDDLFNSHPIMKIYVDTEYYKGYAVIGDFHHLLELHTTPEVEVMQQEIDDYQGVDYETSDSG